MTESQKERIANLYAIKRYGMSLPLLEDVAKTQSHPGEGPDIRASRYDAQRHIIAARDFAIAVEKILE